LAEERNRVVEFLDATSLKIQGYSIMYNNIKKPIYLSYEKIDKHIIEVRKLMQEIENVDIPDDLIPAYYNQDMQDL
jgi:hypothetical protein